MDEFGMSADPFLIGNRMNVSGKPGIPHSHRASRPSFENATDGIDLYLRHSHGKEYFYQSGAEWAADLMRDLLPHVPMQYWNERRLMSGLNMQDTWLKHNERKSTGTLARTMTRECSMSFEVLNPMCNLHPVASSTLWNGWIFSEARYGQDDAKV